jgi:large subunit ribosomal protein L16
MAYLPSRTKYRKVHTGRIYGTAQSCNTLAFGEFGIQSLTRGRMTSQQIEAARVAMTRSLKRKGKVWIRVFPHKPVTKKPAETRMGKGKGSVENAGCSQSAAQEALRLADTKLPFHCRFVTRED